MKLHISAIPDGGLTIDFAKREPWQLHLVHEIFHERNPDLQSLAGNLLLVNTEKNISMTGELRVFLNPSCDRCLVPFTYDFRLPIMLVLAPLYHSAKEKERLKGFEEEVEAARDDDGFYFYEDHSIDIGEIISEQALLVCPVQFICSEVCRGLCSQCGANLNHEKCACSQPNPD